MESTPAPPTPRLEPILVGSEYTDSYEIVFMRDAPGGSLTPVRSTVARAEEGSIDNQPYAANESYTFVAELTIRRGAYVVMVTQLKVLCQVGAKVRRITSQFTSLDGGSTWEEIDLWDPKTLAGGRAPQIVSRIVGPWYGGQLRDG